MIWSKNHLTLLSNGNRLKVVAMNRLSIISRSYFDQFITLIKCY